MIVVAGLISLLAAYQVVVAILVQIGAALSSRRIPSVAPESLPTLSLLVPARDEEETLPRLLGSLESQVHLFENIVFINDQSKDRTGEILDAFRTRFPARVDVVHLKEKKPSQSPKLEAMKQGMHLVKGEVLLLTDADCVVPGDWARQTASAFADSQIALTIGPIVTRRGGTLLGSYAAAEHLYRYLGAAGLAGLGIPAGGFGNNMAIRLETLTRLGGLSAVQESVTEDAALVHLVRQKTGRRVRALMTRGTTVTSEPVTSWGGLLKQITRWQVGAVYSHDLESMLGMGALIVGYIVAIPLFVAGFWMPMLWIQPLGAVIGASIMILGCAVQLHQPLRFWLMYPVHLLLVIAVNAITGLSALIRPRVVWKGASIDVARRRQ